MAIAPDQSLGFSGTSTTTITVSGTFPAGALILVAVEFATATSGQSISQSGNTFTTIVTRENSATNNLVYFHGYIKNWAGGALSTTFTLSGAGKDAGARLLSFTGADTTAPLLLSHDAGGAPKSTTMDSGAATGTTNSTDLVVGFFGWANTADISGTITEGTTPASGWTITAHSGGSSANTPHGWALFSYQILSSAVTNPDASVTFTVPSAGVSYSATVATFKAAGGSTVQGALDLGHQHALGLTPAPLLAGTLDLGHNQALGLTPAPLIAGKLDLGHEQALGLAPGGLIQGQLGLGNQQALLLAPTIQANDSLALQHQSGLGLTPGALIQGRLDLVHSHGLAPTWSSTSVLKTPSGLVVDALRPLGSLAQGGLIGSAADALRPGGSVVDALKPTGTTRQGGPTGTVVNS